MEKNNRPIITADGHEVKEGDRVFSHYTMSWGVITNPLASFGNDDPWFDFVQDSGKKDYLNGERIAKNKPSWIGPCPGDPS